MRIEEFQKYFETLELAQHAIGINRANRKQLQRLEEIKQLILEYYHTGSTLLDFDYRKSYKDYFENLENYLSSNEAVRRIYLRSDISKCKVPGRPWLIGSDDVYSEGRRPDAGFVVGLYDPTITSIGDSSLEVGDSLNPAAAIVA